MMGYGRITGSDGAVSVIPPNLAAKGQAYQLKVTAGDFARDEEGETSKKATALGRFLVERCTCAISICNCTSNLILSIGNALKCGLERRAQFHIILVVAVLSVVAVLTGNLVEGNIYRLDKSSTLLR